MELDPDYHRLAQLHENQQRSGIWWVTTIVLGVLLGNLLSFGCYKLYQQWEYHRLRTAFAEVVEESSKWMAADRARRALEREQADRKRQGEREIHLKLAQTCRFWTQQVARENIPKNRAYRDMACAKLR